MSLSDRMAQVQAPGRAADPHAGIRRDTREALMGLLGPQLSRADLSDDALRTLVHDGVRDVLAGTTSPLTVSDRGRIAAGVADDILGHGPLEAYLRDPSVSEIMVNGPGQVYIERAGRLLPSPAVFDDEAHLRRVIDKIVARAGRRVDESSPMADARLPDGSRVNAVVPPVALDGSLLTIRKFPASPLEAADLLRSGTLTPGLLALLRACVLARLNIVISGGTGSGKTTTLNVLSGFAGPGERIVTIEDTAELQLRQAHVLRLETRPPNLEGTGAITIRDLVRNALRMRPDRIIVGEVRDGAALDMLQAMNTGHDGSITTVHANSPEDALARLETMTLMADVALPQQAVREQIGRGINVIIHQARMLDGSRRVTGVAEVAGVTGGRVVLRHLMAAGVPGGGEQPLLGLLASRGHPAAPLQEEW